MNGSETPILPKPAKPYYLWFWLGQTIGIFGTAGFLKFTPYATKNSQTSSVFEGVAAVTLTALLLVGILYVSWFVTRLVWPKVSLYGAKKFWFLAGTFSFPLWFAACAGWAVATASKAPEAFAASIIYWLGAYLLSPAILLALSAALGTKSKRSA